MEDENRFLERTKAQLAKRAGYMCSICGKLTIGPSSESDESVTLSGEAAHIHSANEGGRRYKKDMTPSQRSDIINGIWLCRNHHKVVDSDESDYSVPFLINVKANHQQRVKLLNDGISLESGMITKLTLKNIGSFKEKCEIEFGNITLIFGRSGTGKTLITDFISSLNSISKIDKWKSRRNKGSSNIHIEYYDSTVKTFGLNYSFKNEISYVFNGAFVPAFLSPYECFFFENDFIRDYYNPDSITESLAKYFKIEKAQVAELINHINKTDKEFINEIYIEGDDLRVMMNAKSPNLHFGSLSSGEQYRVIVEIGLRLADYYSKYKSLIVILEHTALGSLDTAGVDAILESVKNRKSNYQFIFTSYMKKEQFEYSDFLTYDLNFTNEKKEEAKITLANNTYE